MHSGSSDPSLSSLSLESLERIDNVCVAFESELSNETPPRIEDFLKSDSVEEKEVLLRELLHLELAAQETLGAASTQAEYETRFAELAHVVREAFSRPSPDTSAVRDYSGQLIAGRYRVGSLLGTGAFSDVYLAEDVEQQRPVALKLLKPQAGADLELLLNEAKTLTELEHPNIVAAYDFGRFDDSAFIALQYVDGQTLAEKLSGDGKIDSDEAVQIATAICDALHCAHQHGLTHRDIKPHNILIDSNGHAFVADFGFALHESVQDQHFGDRSGTPYYRSPEQVRGEADWIDGRSDIWAVGAVLYEMLTGRRPFQSGTDKSIEEIDRQILGRSPKPPRQINSSVPPWLEAVCLKALEKTPDARYTTASELANALRAKVHPYRLRFSRKLIATAAAIMLGLGGLALVATWNARSERIARHEAQATALDVIEYSIRNLHDLLMKQTGDESNAYRQILVTNAIAAADGLDSDTKHADLLRANTRYRLADLLVENRGKDNLGVAETQLAEALQILEQRDAKSQERTDRTPYLRLTGNIQDALGQIDYLKQEYTAALEHFDKALQCRTEWQSIVSSGMITNASPFAHAAKDAAPEIKDMTEQERVEQAIADSQYNFARIKRKDPKNTLQTHKLLKNVSDARKRWYDAHSTYLPAKRDYGGSLRDLAKAESSIGNYDQAIVQFREAIRLTREVIELGSADLGSIDLYPPKSNLPVFLCDLAETLMRNGNIGEAAICLQDARTNLVEFKQEFKVDGAKEKYLGKRLGQCWYLIGLQQTLVEDDLANDSFESSCQLLKGSDAICSQARLHKRELASRLTVRAQKNYSNKPHVNYTIDFAKCFAVCAWSAQQQKQIGEYERFRDKAIGLLEIALARGVPEPLIRDDPELRFLNEDSIYVNRIVAKLGTASDVLPQL